MYLPNNTLLQGGKYKIVRFISSGGFGNTYEGLDVNLNKRVAIKEFFVKDFCVRDAGSTRVTVTVPGKKALIEHLKHKFVEEARAIANMEHENIVDVKALFEENGTAYYVMDFIDGESVADVLKRRGSLPESEALPIILKVASALGYMHSENRFHLDVKPGNIMLRKKDGKVVLIDFGSSKQYAEVDGENTTTMAPCYTPGYAAPEQMNSKSTRYSAATDIYALGATLHKMLTGLTPPSSIDLLSKEEALSPLLQEISKNVRECVMRAMILQRVDRMQSIEEFVALLTSVSDADEVTLVDVESERAEAERRRKEAEAKAARERAEEARRREEARKREEAARKAAEEEQKNKAQSSNGSVWKFWVGFAIVGVIAAIGIGNANRGGEEEDIAADSTVKDTVAVALDDTVEAVVPAVVQLSSEEKEKIIKKELAKYILGKTSSVTLSPKAKSYLIESTWPGQIYCEVEEIFGWITDDLWVDKIGKDRYRFSCICSCGVETYVDNWSIYAVCDDNGSVTITEFAF